MANVEEMIEWLGSDNIEKTDLKKGDYIEIDLNSSFQYGGKLVGVPVVALEFKDIDKDCKPLNLRVRGLKIFGRVLINFISVKLLFMLTLLKNQKKFNLK